VADDLIAMTEHQVLRGRCPADDPDAPEEATP
jgi:glutamate--cysteine ligase